MSNNETGGWFRPLYGNLTGKLSDAVRRRGDDVGALSDDEVSHLALALLDDAIRVGASDIHLEPHRDGIQVRLRVDGALLDTHLLRRAHGERIQRHFKSLGGLDPIGAFRPQDARESIDVAGTQIDVRLSTAPCAFGEKLAMRLLDPRRIKEQLDELGISDALGSHIRSWMNSISGMFLVGGPTGCGKTTTLYALLHQLRLAERSVVTIEDPIEYRLEGISQMQVDARHGLTFAEGLRAMLRLDPDYMLLGEIRDSAAAHAAIEAAMSGRVLMSTLHCRDAAGVVTALRNWGAADHEISVTLQLVVSQRLVRRLCPACRSERAPTEAERIWLDSLGQPAPPRVWTAAGCDECRQLGYSGRTGVFEVWRLDESDAARIAARSGEAALRKSLMQRGHTFLFHDALAKAQDGTTSLDEVRALSATALTPSESLALA